MNEPDSSDQQAAILFQAALVCGAGANARSAVRQLTEHALLSPERRSCIDGGAPMLLVIRTPGDRVLDVCVRQPDTLAGAQTWRRTRFDGFARESWYTRLFPAASLAATVEARDMAQDAHVEAEFERLHAVLGAGARPFLVAKQHVPDADRVWIGWNLDQHFHPSRAMASLGMGDAWRAMTSPLEALLGRTVPLRSSGWCILAGLGGDRTRIRIGTTQWSRVPEGRAKFSNLRRTVSAIGGDPRFAEAIYRLLLPAENRERQFVRPVGCAIEIEVEPAGSITTDLLLRIPCPSTAKLPTFSAPSTAAA